jgi:hypothetical protein
MTMFEVIKIRENPAIEAVQFTEIEKNRVFRWIKCNCYADFNSYGEPILKIDSPKGVLTANLGDYIIREEGGLYYPVPPQEFYEFYDTLDDNLSCDEKALKSEYFEYRQLIENDGS